MSALLPVNRWEDILPGYRATPVADLLAYHNLRTPHRSHDQCGMVDLHGRREIFVSGLVENGGWERREAEQHFDRFSAVFEIRDPVEFVLSEARRLREHYPRVMVAALFYRVDEGLLYQITEAGGG